MPYTEVQVCNLALGYIGVEQTLAAIDPVENDNPASVQCARYFEHARDGLLEDHQWPFAQKYFRLTETGDSQNANDEWVYEYGAPTDMIRAIKIVRPRVSQDSTATVINPVLTEEEITVPAEPIPFQVAIVAGTGRVIWSNWQDAVLLYTMRMDDPAFWPSGFAEALAWRLAISIAIPLSQSQATRDRAQREYLLAVGQGMSNAANEIGEDPHPKSKYETGRQ